jgi:hypothetical protein
MAFVWLMAVAIASPRWRHLKGFSAMLSYGPDACGIG